MTDGTTKAQIDEVTNEIQVFCRTAQTLVHSFMPVGLGKYWQREEDELIFQLTEIPMRFKRAVEKAQAKGWAAK